MVKTLLLTLIFILSFLDTGYAQRFRFEEAVISYSFEDSTHNYESIVVGDLGLFDSEKGVLIFGFPLDPILRISDKIGFNHGLSSKIMLQHQGLFWGDYDMKSNGNYIGNTRGLLTVQNKKVSRGFASQTVIAVNEELDFIETSLTFELSSVPGLEVFGSEESFLNKEVKISIKITNFES
ncbi:MAG: hypothetical protein RIE52_08390 [Balneola sp.]|jgi:hypothetical protein